MDVNEPLTRPEDRPAAIEARCRLERAQTLIAAGRALAAARNLEEVVVIVGDLAVAALQADCATVLLHDDDRHQLCARTLCAGQVRESRYSARAGIAGAVFRTGTPAIVADAAADERFDPAIDQPLGLVAGSLACLPLIEPDGSVLGVIQCLSTRRGRFTADDLDVLDGLCTLALPILLCHRTVDAMRRSRQSDADFLQFVADITAETDIERLIDKVMHEASYILEAERAVLLINDAKAGEVWSIAADDPPGCRVRLPNDRGVTGLAVTQGEVINLPHAYADLRFDPNLDNQLGSFTRSLLCAPVVDRRGRPIAVIHALNKIGGAFTATDEQRLVAFASQIAVALERVRLFQEMQSVRNYTDCMLQSMSNGVITLDRASAIVTCNAAALRMICRRSGDVVGRGIAEILSTDNRWLLDKIEKVMAADAADVSIGCELIFGERRLSVNATVQPLVSPERIKIGTMIVLEDITNEKRIKAAMARYMDPRLAEEVLTGGNGMLGGRSTLATILFSDIRGFTALSEKLGPQATVGLLNEYFTRMVECLHREGGMLDKFIGDALMAAFGVPIARADDEDRAVRAAIAMHRELGAWNQHRRENGQAPIDIGIGINTDRVVWGNIGSPRRMDCTIIGDGVNLAARIEKACKEYRAHILISDNTVRRLREHYRIRHVDLVAVRGRSDPVVLHEVLDHHSAASFPLMEDNLRNYARGISAYRQRSFAAARRSFERALRCTPGDFLSRMYVERCEALMRNPPPAEWNGVWPLTEA